MSYDTKKAAAKAKRTRAKNLKAKEAADKKYKSALSRARNAENKLKAYKEGFKDGINAQGGKI